MSIDHLLLLDRARLAASSTDDWIEKERLLLESLHPHQRSFVIDPGRRIAALVARRAGKTTGGRARFVRRMLRQKKAQCVYIALTRPHAEELMWAPLKDLAEQLGLEATFNETKMKMTLRRNGAELQLVGADDKREIEKLRGRKFHEAGIDEGASHPRSLLESLILRILGPALADFRGPLWIVGTPGHVLSGTFYDATRPGSDISRLYADRDLPEFRDWQRWSKHAWSLEDNTAQPQLWEEALREKEANNWSDENPIWRREYIGLWAADDTEYVYRFRSHTDDGKPWNIWTPEAKTKENPFGLPGKHRWSYVYGIDFGSGGTKREPGEAIKKGDPFALQILAFSETTPELYQAYEYVSPTRLHVTAVAKLVERLIEITGHPDGIVGDIAGSGGMILDELRDVHGIPIEAAEKKSKNDAIELLNSDLVDGLFKALPGSAFVEQAQHLQWDETGLKENKGQRNDALDATIYARRKARHQFARDPDPEPPIPGTPDALEREMEALLDRSRRKHRGEEDFFAGDDSSFDDFLRGDDGSFP